jgi:hypothetical protein
LIARSIWIRNRIIETSRIFVNFAVGNVNISISFSIRELSKSTNNKSISVVHISTLGFKIAQKFISFTIDSNLVAERRIVSIDDLET